MTRVDRLREDGWTECGTCGGYGYALPDEEPDRGWSGRCPDCAHGLVPPDGMVYAATRKVFRGVMPAGFQIERVRAGLVAAARWEAPGE